MFKLVLALSFAAIVCECSLIRRDLLSNRSDSCRELLECASPLSNVLSADVGELTELPNETAYALVCQHLQAFKTWFEDSKNECDNTVLQNVIKQGTAVADFTCTPEGQEDDAKRQKAQELKSACVDDYNLEIRTKFDARQISRPCDYYPYQKKMYSCVVTGINDQCGEEFGRFFSQVWQIQRKSSVENSDCATSI